LSYEGRTTIVAPSRPETTRNCCDFSRNP